MEAITEFTYEYGFLSNFHPSEVSYGGLVYPSVEHAYQAAKTLDLEEQRKIREAHSPGEAKRRGRAAALRPDWDDIKDEVMMALVWAKFQEEPLRSRLLATGEAILIEGNNWGDRYWGVDGHGLNKLGLTLMAVRAGLRAAA